MDKGRVRIRTFGRATGNTSAVYWITADTNTQRYRVFRLNGAFNVETDAARLYAHFASRNQDVTLAGMSAVLQRVYEAQDATRKTRQLRISQGRAGLPNRAALRVAQPGHLALSIAPKLSARQTDEWCDGDVTLQSITVDPINAALTHTIRDIAWQGWGPYLNMYYRDGDCDATSNITVWFETFCQGYPTYSSLYVHEHQHGDFRNWDFGFDWWETDAHSYVAIEAYSSDDVQHWTDWSASGEWNDLLSEVVDYEYNRGSNCF